MATGKRADSSVVGRLAGRGEDALTRLLDELSKNTVVTDALARAMSAKGRLDSASRGALGGVGLAAADDIRDLRKQLADLEKRLAKLEGGGKTQTRPRKTTSTKTTQASKRSGSSGSRGARPTTPPA